MEAKAYIEEAVDFRSQASPESLDKIRRALQQARGAFGADRRAHWEAPFYQYANRLRLLVPQFMVLPLVMYPLALLQCYVLTQSLLSEHLCASSCKRNSSSRSTRKGLL